MAEKVAEAVALGAEFMVPNTKGAYTDLNYVLLGEIVKRVTSHDVSFTSSAESSIHCAGPAGAILSSMRDLHTFARAVCRGGILTPALQVAMLAGQPLEHSATRYGEGVISNGGICGHSGTINGFNTDMYHFANTDTTIIINVSRLDETNVPPHDTLSARRLQISDRTPCVPLTRARSTMDQRQLERCLP